MRKDKIILYTCITNGKDTLKDYATEDGIEYICFTDGTVDDISGWNMHDLKWKHEDPRRVARYHKILSQKVLPEHGYSIWIDGALFPRVRIHDLINWCNTSDFLVRRHPGWDCIYQEANAILHYGFDSKEVIDNVINKYTQENFPKNYGMHETGVLIRKNTQIIHDFNNVWWNEVENGSKRDQMSFDYVRWKTNQTITELPREWFGTDPSIGFCGHKHED